MRRASIQRLQRDILRRRFAFACAYCGVSETDAGAELTVDHFQPRSLGGNDDADNLVLCCHACNEFKGNFWPLGSAPSRRLLHPERDELARHISSDEDGTLRGFSATGQFHISRLHLNRPALIALRQRRREEADNRRELERALQRLEQLEEQIQILIEQIALPNL